VFAKTMIEGKSVRASARACGVHYTTTFRWRHRFLSIPEEKQAQVLRGIAEAEPYKIGLRKQARTTTYATLEGCLLWQHSNSIPTIWEPSHYSDSLVKLVEVAGVEPASEGTAGQHLQA